MVFLSRRLLLWLMLFYLLKIEFQIVCKQWRSRSNVWFVSNVWTILCHHLQTEAGIHQECHRFIPKFPVEWIPSLFSLDEHTTTFQLKMDDDNFFFVLGSTNEKKTLFREIERHRKKGKWHDKKEKERKLKIAFINYTLTLNVCVGVRLYATTSHTNLHPFRSDWMSWRIEVNWSQKKVLGNNAHT